MPVPAGPGGPPPVPGDPIYYDPVLSRVRITVDSLSDLAPVTVQRSTNQVTWTTVRGGGVTPSGGAIRVDDYEFTPGVPNHYRVVGPVLWDGYGRTVSSSWSDADSGQTYTTAGGSTSDHSVSGGTGRQSNGTVNAERMALVDVGATDVAVSQDMLLPVASAAGGPIRLRLLGRAASAGTNYYAQLELDTSGVVRLSLARRVSDSATTVTSGVVAGTNGSNNWWRVTLACAGNSLTATCRNLTAGGSTTTITGTDSNITTGTQIGCSSVLVASNTNTLPLAFQFDNLVVTTPGQVLFSDDITPVVDRVWIKSLARPFLNRAVVVQDYGEVERPSRAGVFEVIGRTYPVAVNDVRGSRRWTLDLLTATAAEAADVDMLLASGDTLLVQVPADCDVPGGYVSVGSTAVRRTARRTARRIISLPCTEVAAPGPDVVGATVTWQGVLNTYGSWAAVIAAHPTWADLLELIGDPTDVIVP